MCPQGCAAWSTPRAAPRLDLTNRLAPCSDPATQLAPRCGPSAVCLTNCFAPCSGPRPVCLTNCFAPCSGPPPTGPATQLAPLPDLLPVFLLPLPPALLPRCPLQRRGCRGRC